MSLVYRLTNHDLNILPEEQDEENPSEAAERHPSGDETFSTYAVHSRISRLTVNQGNRRTSRPRISDGSTKPPLKKTRIASPSDPEIHAGTSQDIIRKFTDTDRVRILNLVFIQSSWGLVSCTVHGMYQRQSTRMCCV